MSFGQHIYLIKSERNDQDLTSREWTASFHRFLELLLSRLAGEKISVNVITDQELDVESMYSPMMMLIPIVSNDLLNSTTFKEELKIFHEKAINKSNNSISWNSRIFKVLREPQKGHFLLDYLSDSTNYDFFHIDIITEEVVVYDDFTGPTSEKTFWMRLYDLAYDAFKVIEETKSVESQIAQLSNQINSVTIYLAEVGADLAQQRDNIKRELTRNGYRVLPEKNLSSDAQSVTKAIKKDLKASDFSIHLIGSDEGTIGNTEVSIIDLQNKLATDHIGELEQMNSGGNQSFNRVIWINPELANLGVRQRLFIENLRKDSESISNAELLETSIEELKLFITNMIDSEIDLQSKFSGSKKPAKGKSIYLIHDKSESKRCKKIESILLKSGYDVIMPDFTGNPDEVRHKHNDNLRKCDASLIYYGHENDEWIRSKQKDLMKSLGLGREKPISPQAILIENESELDESLELNEKAIILQSNKRFSAKVMEPFFAQLEQ